MGEDQGKGFTGGSDCPTGFFVNKTKLPIPVDGLDLNPTQATIRALVQISAKSPSNLAIYKKQALN